MKQRNLKKKAGALLLAAAMMVNLFPAFRTEVHAAELPDNTQFAEKADLTAFNTNDNDGTKNPAKVYFGNSNQQWWIAGSQSTGSMTLFAASPLATGQVFESNYNSDKTYNRGWNCDYTSTGGSVPADVYPNHYGASPLRATLRNLESSYFTSAEQSLMNDTTIYTNDTKNSSVYSTTEKLYLAYGDYNNNQYITVGTNNSNSLNGGLRIDKGYWGNDGPFWLRAPNLSNRSYALAALPGLYVDFNYVLIGYALVPAFELNLSSVIFASAAPAAVSDGALTLADTDGDGAFTLRYSAGSLGAAQVAYDYTKVNVTDAQSGTYLVAQNKDGAWAKAVSGTASVSASDMGTGFTSFENCRVWLETTDSSERKTYATMATQETAYTVNIADNSTLKITSNNAAQRVKTGNAITDITVKANDGYYFSDEYVTELNQQLGGLTVEKSDDFTLKISGTPRSDVTITLPGATKYYAVNVTLGTGMQVQSGRLTQKVDDGESMTVLVIEAGSGYMFPADYSVAGQNGITVTRNSDSQITVSGTPTADVNLTLPAATGTPGGRYKIIEGADQTWKGSGSLTIKANGDFSKFTGIKVDKAAVDSSNYEAKSGSTVVTLKESYLVTLSAGVHTLTFVYNDGEVSTHFTVAEAEKQGTPTAPADSEKGDSSAARSPWTGDNTDTALWALLLVLSVLLMAFAVQIRKQTTYLKHKRK